VAVNAVIFDIDGTLVDSVDLHARAWQEAFEHFDYHLPFSRVRHQIGKGADKLIPELLGEEEANRVFEPLDKFRGQLWKTQYLPQVKPFPKVRALFDRILDDGKKIVLASSSKSDELKKYKQIANIDDLVEDETSADDVEESKPSPDPIEAALTKLDHPDLSTVIMVGDTPWDIMAAGKAGVRSIGVLCGGFPEEELRGAGSIEIYKHPGDLLQHYPSSPLAGKESRAA
jgi:HAD superfamily hydrolase (TIGR01549 family)